MNSGLSNHVIKPPNHQTLVGSLGENFYILGKKDKPLLERLSSVIGLSSKTLYGPKTTLFRDEILDSYAEGLGKKPQEVINLYRHLEYLSLKGQNPNQFPYLPIHHAHFYWPKHSQSPLYQFSNQPYWWAQELGLKAQFLLLKTHQTPTMIIMSYEGLSLAWWNILTVEGSSYSLHHRYHHLFHPEGFSRFELIHEISLSHLDLDQQKKWIRTQSSLAPFALFSTEASGESQVIEMIGPQFYHLKKTIDHSHSFKINSQFIQNIDNDSLAPSLNHLNETKPMQDKINSPSIEFSSRTLDLNIHFDFENYPIHHPFNGFQLSHTHFKKNLSSYELENKFLRLAQFSMSTNDLESASHFIQMNLSLSKTQHPILHFLWIVLQNHFLKEKKEINILYLELLSTFTTLPDEWKDHAMNMIFLFEHALGLASTQKNHVFINLKIKQVNEKMKRLSKEELSQINKMIIPRFDILDIIYPPVVYNLKEQG